MTMRPSAIVIPDGEIRERFVRSSGPGGQNVNKVATAVELRFDVRASSLPADVKERLIALAGNRIVADGVLLIDSRVFRSQAQNREAARARLMALVPAGDEEAEAPPGHEAASGRARRAPVDEEEAERGQAASRSKRTGRRLTMPLVSLDRVSLAFGHLPLLDAIALQVDTRERVAIIGRNGTGKSTLLKDSQRRACRPMRARCGAQPALARRAARAGRAAVRRSRRCSTLSPTAIRTVSMQTKSGCASTTWTWCCRGSVCRRDAMCRHAVGRMAPPRAAGARARRPARSAAPRRADQSSRYRRHRLARRLSRRLRGAPWSSSPTIARFFSVWRLGSSSSTAAG